MSGSAPGTSSLGTESEPGVAVRAWCDDEQVYVELTDGRVATHPLPDFVRDVSSQKRGTCQVEEFGTVLWWPALDEGIGLNWVFGVREHVIEELAGLGKRST